MLYLLTGLTGASKTLNAIKLACEDSTFADRQVYYYGIQDCTVPGWKELTLDQLRTWYELPTGSVVVVDEAQEVYPVAPNGSTVPEDIMKLFRNRRLGIDLIFVTIDPTLLHFHVRKAVKFHYHLERPDNSGTATWYCYQKCETNPLNGYTLKYADTRRVKLDQKYFGLYKSAEQHTEKRRIPRYFFHILFFSFLILIAAYITYQAFKPDSNESVQSSSNPRSTSQKSTSLLSSRKRQPLTIDEYIEQHKPRLKDIPKSAPIFDDVTKVNDYPRPQCIYKPSNNSCICYTQQATRMDVSFDTCNHYVFVGFSFDYSQKPYTQTQRSQRVQLGETSSRARALTNAFPSVHQNPSVQLRTRENSRPTYPTSENSYGGIR